MGLVFAPSQIETWPIDRLRPYARNAKQHGDDQVAKIAASMAGFGWTLQCMVADDGDRIAGYGLVRAATILGLRDMPVSRAGEASEETYADGRRPLFEPDDRHQHDKDDRGDTAVAEQPHGVGRESGLLGNAKHLSPQRQAEIKPTEMRDFSAISMRLEPRQR